MLPPPPPPNSLPGLDRFNLCFQRSELLMLVHIPFVQSPQSGTLLATGSTTSMTLPPINGLMHEMSAIRKEGTSL